MCCTSTSISGFKHSLLRHTYLAGFFKDAAHVSLCIISISYPLTSHHKQKRNALVAAVYQCMCYFTLFLCFRLSLTLFLSWNQLQLHTLLFYTILVLPGLTITWSNNTHTTHFLVHFTIKRTHGKKNKNSKISSPLWFNELPSTNIF